MPATGGTGCVRHHGMTLISGRNHCDSDKSAPLPTSSGKNSAANQQWEFPPGSMIMSEAAVQKEYNVSRVTVRKAFKLLIDKGILRAIRGKGTFVNDVETQDWTWMKSFSREVLGFRPCPYHQAGQIPCDSGRRANCRPAYDSGRGGVLLSQACPLY